MLRLKICSGIFWTRPSECRSSEQVGGGVIVVLLDIFSIPQSEEHKPPCCDRLLSDFVSFTAVMFAIAVAFVVRLRAADD